MNYTEWWCTLVRSQEFSLSPEMQRLLTGVTDSTVGSANTKMSGTLLIQLRKTLRARHSQEFVVCDATAGSCVKLATTASGPSGQAHVIHALGVVRSQ